MSPQLPYMLPRSAHAQGVAQSHDFGAQRPSQQGDAQPEENIAIPAETTPAANRLRVKFFMPPIIPQANGKWRMENEILGYFLSLAVTTSAQWSVASGAAITLRERTSMRSAWAVSTMI